MIASDRHALLTACLWDDHAACHESVPDPWSEDPEEPSLVVCACDCHVYASHLETPELTLDEAAPPF